MSAAGGAGNRERGTAGVTDGHLLGEGEGDEEQRQPHGDAGDDLVERQLQPQPLVARLRRLLQQEVGEDVLGGDVRDGHGGHGSAGPGWPVPGWPVPGWVRQAGPHSGTPPQPGPAPPGGGRGARSPVLPVGRGAVGSARAPGGHGNRERLGLDGTSKLT